MISQSGGERWGKKGKKWLGRMVHSGERRGKKLVTQVTDIHIHTYIYLPSFPYFTLYEMCICVCLLTRDFPISVLRAWEGI